MKINVDLILDAVYPVGSIYMSVSATSPATLFGGKWEQLKDRFLLGCGTHTNGSTGGEETHTLTVSEMPSHSHKAGWQGNDLKSAPNNGNDWVILTDKGDSVYTDSTGGNAAHNNMPPYLAVYIWKRTA